jgi:hypothetical protein
MSRNLAASVRARLKQHADAIKQDFNLTLTHYGLERLLYRLSVSEHASNFLLKGALLFTLWYGVAHRPTRDADLLGFGPDDVDTAVKTFREICLTPAEDGVVFDPDSVKGSIIFIAHVHDQGRNVGFTQNPKSIQAAFATDQVEADNPGASLALDELSSEKVSRLIDHPGLGRPGCVASTRGLVAHQNYRALL